MKQQERKRRAELAAATLNHDYIQACFKDLRQGVLVELERTAHDEQSKREDLYYLLRSVKALEGLLFSHIQDGKLAESQIQNIDLKKVIR